MGALSMAASVRYPLLAAVASLAVLVAAGCSTRSIRVEPGAPDAAPATAERYSEEPGRTPATVAAFRAAPPPAAPEWSEGEDFLADRNRLGAAGMAHVGSSRFTPWDAAAREQAVARARAVGADRAIVYTGTAAAADDTTLVAYYVRFRLPFGATFRDLREEERAAVGSAGVRIGTVLAGTPAEEANLIAGDVVVAVDGAPVTDRAGFQALLRNHAGRRVALRLIRNGEPLERSVRLGAPAQP